MSNLDVDILELLSSRICHDLISPIGAVNNGVEFLEEMGAEAGQDVIDLVAFSAQQASAKLQAYRMAYGAGGADHGLKPENVHESIDKIISAEKKITQDWDPHGPLGPEDYPVGFCKMLISCILLAMECLPKGGKISVEPGEGRQTLIKAEGEDAAPRGDSEQALNQEFKADSMEPKLVHPFITGLIASHYGFSVSFAEKSANSVTIILETPQSA